jgi:Phosphopantetheine attachment site
MSTVTSMARALVRQCLDSPTLLDAIADGEDLMAHGVNSGEIIRVALECERRIGRMLTDEELTELSTVDAIARLIGRGGEHVA